MTPRKATRADVAHALRAYPDGVTPSILSADLKVRPEVARSALNRLHEYGGCVREGNLYREGMEDQLGALGLVVNAVTFWNTRYLTAAMGWLEAIGEDVYPQDVVRLSPLKYAHVNMLGRYPFEIADDIAAGALRPLRDPDAIQSEWLF